MALSACHPSKTAAPQAALDTVQMQPLCCGQQTSQKDRGAPAQMLHGLPSRREKRLGRHAHTALLWS